MKLNDLSTKDGLMKVVCRVQIQRRFVQQMISEASTIACNTETAAVKHKSQTHFLLTERNSQSEDLLVVGFATAADPYRALGLHS